MALDYGDRYVGIAISDYEGKIALRHSVIDKKKQELFVGLKNTIEKEEPEKIVVGMPVGLSGVETEQTAKTREFVAELKENIENGIQIEEADETFTSKEAKRIILEEGGSMDEEHTEAARLILESYLKR